MKEFLMLIRETTDYGKISPEEMQEDIEKHIQWVETLMEKGLFKSGNPLEARGITIKGANQVVTDGPYIEGKECVSGFYFLLANSLQEATTIAKGCPSLTLGASVELREVIQTEEG